MCKISFEKNTTKTIDVSRDAGSCYKRKSPRVVYVFQSYTAQRLFTNTIQSQRCTRVFRIRNTHSNFRSSHSLFVQLDVFRRIRCISRKIIMNEIFCILQLQHLYSKYCCHYRIILLVGYLLTSSIFLVHASRGRQSF